MTPISITHTLTISLSAQSETTTVAIGKGILEDQLQCLVTNGYSNVIAIVDCAVESVLAKLLSPNTLSPEDTLILDAGESAKELSTIASLWDFFYARHVDRKSLVIAVGGGTISDTVGFAAATYMRGVPYAVVPTTLLAQVDAAIGGKNGINYRDVKNLIGAIHQPVSIIADLDTLNGLPPKEMLSGFSEIVKHGLIADSSYFELVTSRPYTAWSKEELVDLIHTSCKIKARIVASDERERDYRKALNLGHTIGHAVEALFLHTSNPLTHGEAVAIGMNAESWLSYKLNKITEEQYRAICTGILNVGLPLQLPKACDASAIIEKARSDKKNVGGEIRWTLLEEIGRCEFDCVVPIELVELALQNIQPPR